MPDKPKPKAADSPPEEEEEAEELTTVPIEEAAPVPERPTRMQKRRVLTPRNG